MVQKWILQYVDGIRSLERRNEIAEAPRHGTGRGRRNRGGTGYYTSKFFFAHYQLEGLTVSLRLVGRLPSAKGGG